MVITRFLEKTKRTLIETMPTIRIKDTIDFDVPGDDVYCNPGFLSTNDKCPFLITSAAQYAWFVPICELFLSTLKGRLLGTERRCKECLESQIE